MFEKVNPSHPDKMADRLAGAIVDMAYAKSENPKIAVEVLAGHGKIYVIIETSLSSEQLRKSYCEAAIHRIFGKDVEGEVIICPQDEHLADNQRGAMRCGDNGIFKGCPVTVEQKVLTSVAASIYERWPYDGKYIIGCGEDHMTHLTICQSHAKNEDIEQMFAFQISTLNYQLKVNPLGEWTGGPGVDCGATNRKLGSDMGDGVTGGGLPGKDLSKADVSVNIYCHLLAQRERRNVCASCSIGDTDILFKFGSSLLSLPYEYVVKSARQYINELGGFEKFAEWGLIRPIEN